MKVISGIVFSLLMLGAAAPALAHHSFAAEFDATKPWTSAWDTYTLASEDLIENFCTDNENIDQLRKLNAIEATKGK